MIEQQVNKQEEPTVEVIVDDNPQPPTSENTSTKETAAQIQEPSKAQHQPPPDSPRFNQIYGRMKEEERKNADLSNKVTNLETQLNSVSKVQQEGEINRLATQRQEAVEAGDYAKENQINTKMMQILSQNNAAQIQQPPPPTAYPQIPHQPFNPTQEAMTQAPTPNVSMADYADYADEAVFKVQNPWYESDDAMTATMITKMHKINNDPQFAHLPFSERLKEGSIRVKAEFQHKFPNTTPPPTVASAGNGSPPSSKTVVRLSSEEALVAEKLMPFLPKNQARSIYAANLEKEAQHA